MAGPTPRRATESIVAYGTAVGEAVPVNAPTETESGASGRRWTVAAVLGVVVLLAAASIVVVVLANRDPKPTAILPPDVESTVDLTSTPATPIASGDVAASAGTTSGPAPKTTAPKPPGACANCQMSGDQVIYAVGGTGPKGARAGTWHGAGGANCIWTIYSDPNGLHIISQKLAEEDTTLLLRSGTYFQSTGCQPWSWVSA